ncbi:unnamed protein product [Oikopleura dioica]|uniref:Uncharacterized protein n=1 Tax=Oikopleura dioica TaxID=34765 RepID=E4Y8G7_OIKDI|nr:unnamed protein product [Oikopleura dioica]
MIPQGVREFRNGKQSSSPGGNQKIAVSSRFCEQAAATRGGDANTTKHFHLQSSTRSILL